jgi:hypothetical protein
MSTPMPISADEAQSLLARAEPLNPSEVAQILRLLKRSNDDLVGKLRQLKSDMGRLARK